jgi:hypothetical protein
MTRPARLSSVSMTATASAISSAGRAGGVLARWAGVIEARSRRDDGVSVRLGHTQLARIPLLSRNGPSQAVSRITPALAIAYSGMACTP